MTTEYAPGRARVISAELDPANSHRQMFNVLIAAAKEIGKVKIISKLDSVEVIE